MRGATGADLHRRSPDRAALPRARLAFISKRRSDCIPLRMASGSPLDCVATTFYPFCLTRVSSRQVSY